MFSKLQFIIVMLLFMHIPKCISQITFYDIEGFGGTDYIVNATSYNNEVYFVSITNMETFSLNHINDEGILIKKKAIEATQGYDTMIADEKFIFIARSKDGFHEILKYDRITFDFIELVSYELPFEREFLQTSELKFFKNKLMLASFAQEANPPNDCGNNFSTLLVVDMIDFATDTLLTYYDSTFCSNTISSMKQIGDIFRVVVEGTDEWNNNLPFHLLRDQLFVYDYNQDLELVDSFHFINIEEDLNSIWFDEDLMFDNCLTKNGHLILPVPLFGNFLCIEAGAPEGCIPFNSLLIYNGVGELQTVSNNTFVGDTFTPDLRSMTETENSGILFYGNAEIRLYPNYNYTIQNIFNENISTEPFVITIAPYIVSANDQGDLIYRIPTILDEEYKSNLRDITHIFELENDNIIAIGHGLEELSPFPSVREKFGDIYSLIMDKNFCIEGFGCLEVGHTDLTTSNLPIESFSLSIDIYPNPTSEYLHIRTSNIENFQVEIFNNLGNLILSANNSNKLDLTGIHNGNYILKLNDLDANRSVVQKFTILK